MPRTCTKEFTLHVEPSVSSCYTTTTSVASIIGSVLVGGTCASVPNAAYGPSPVNAAIRRFDLSAKVTAGLSAPPASGGLPVATGITFASAGGAIYCCFFDAGAFFGSGYIKWNAETLAELAYLNSGNLGEIYGPFYAAAADAIFAVQFDFSTNNTNLVYVNCATDTIGTILITGVATEFDCRQCAYRPSTARGYTALNAGIPANTRLVLFDNVGTITGTLGAGLLNDWELYGLVYCSSNDRLYSLGRSLVDTNYYALCIDPDTGGVETPIGPIVLGGGALLGKQCTYDPVADRVYIATAPTVAIDPATNIVACTYPVSSPYLQAAYGTAELAIPISAMGKVDIWS